MNGRETAFVDRLLRDKIEEMLQDIACKTSVAGNKLLDH